MSAAHAIADNRFDEANADAAQELERHGRWYGQHRLAVAFTDATVGDGAKRVTKKGWNTISPLPDGNFGAAFLAGRGIDRNPVIVLGASGRILGIDIDGPKGVELLRQIQPDRLPRTWTVRTKSGWHFYYLRPTGATAAATKIELGPGGITISKDGYFVAPPSIHPSGHVYRFADGLAPWDMGPTELPLEQLQRFLAHAQKRREAAIVHTGPIVEGGRHQHLLRVACAMRRVGAGEESIVAALLAENRARCEPPETERAVHDLARDIVARYGPAVNA